MADVAMMGGRLAPAGMGAAVRPMGAVQSKTESLNRVMNMISEDMASISEELDRLIGCRPQDPSKALASCPAGSHLAALQEQLDRADRLAQFTREQLDRIRSL